MTSFARGFSLPQTVRVCSRSLKIGRHPKRRVFVEGSSRERSGASIRHRAYRAVREKNRGPSSSWNRPAMGSLATSTVVSSPTTTLEDQRARTERAVHEVVTRVPALSGRIRTCVNSLGWLKTISFHTMLLPSSPNSTSSVNERAMSTHDVKQHRAPSSSTCPEPFGRPHGAYSGRG